MRIAGRNLGGAVASSEESRSARKPKCHSNILSLVVPHPSSWFSWVPQDGEDAILLIHFSLKAQIPQGARLQTAPTLTGQLRQNRLRPCLGGTGGHASGFYAPDAAAHML